MVDCLFNFNGVAHHPDFQLVEPLLPSRLKFFHPLSIFGRVGNIDHEDRKIVAEKDLVMTPAPLDRLAMERGGVELLDDLVNGLAQQLLRDVAAIIESHRKQHFIAPRFVFHRTFFRPP